VLCVDLGRYSGHDDLLSAVDPLFNTISIYTDVKLIIAHSSGEGFGPCCPDTFKRLQTMDSSFITAKCFSDNKAQAFVNMYGLSNIPMEVIVKQTNRNPLLMQHLKGANSRYWTNKYDLVFMSHLQSTLQKVV